RPYGVQQHPPVVVGDPRPRSPTQVRCCANEHASCLASLWPVHVPSNVWSVAMTGEAQERVMKSFVRSIGMAAGLLLLAGVPQARAQVTGSIQFTTTFPFAVGYATVPAGTYTLRPD